VTLTDIVDAKTRSRMMAGIGGKDTKPELALRRALHARGFRYRLHDKRLPGRPDIVLPKYRAVIFVHGCFWHRHADCRYSATPKTRPEFCAEKFRGNVERDARNLCALQDAGWRTAVLWECALDPAGLHDAAELVARWLPGTGMVLEVGKRL
jgi:DNA mismatch endonuclease (patch repair protein)